MMMLRSIAVKIMSNLLLAVVARASDQPRKKGSFYL